MILNNDMLLTQLNWRYATKKFDPARKIPTATWETLHSTVCACALGYRAEDDSYATAKKVRYEFSEMSEQR